MAKAAFRLGVCVPSHVLQVFHCDVFKNVLKYSLLPIGGAADSTSNILTMVPCDKKTFFISSLPLSLSLRMCLCLFLSLPLFAPLTVPLCLSLSHFFTLIPSSVSLTHSDRAQGTHLTSVMECGRWAAGNKRKENHTCCRLKGDKGSF